MDRARIFFQDHMNSFRSILLGFFVLVLAGAVLLSLPAASNMHQPTPFLDALFTAASASCVTGLAVYDTAMHWSLFGRTVIFLLIQIGGLGVITVTAATLMVTGKRIGILQRSTMQDAISAPQIGGIVRFTRFVLTGTLIVESIGAAALLPVFAKDFGFVKGLGYALFHSVSAFCNAGFDLMGIRGEYSSLTSYAGHAWVNIVIMALIISGGIGFMTWKDVASSRFNLRRITLQTKIILTMTGFLIALPFLYFVFFEFGEMELKERLLCSLFSSVTPRTAGFSTVDYGTMSEGGLLITVLLMLAGGAPGSTAGGIKITTLFVLIIAARSYMTRREDVNCFHRRLESNVIQNAFALLMIYIFLLLAGTVIIASIENLSVMQVLFECASALGTVGLTTGITSSLSGTSKLILIVFMYFGRTGGLTLAYAAVSGKRLQRSRYPAEGIAIG